MGIWQIIEGRRKPSIKFHSNFYGLYIALCIEYIYMYNILLLQVFVTNGVSCAMDCISNVTCSPGGNLQHATVAQALCLIFTFNSHSPLCTCVSADVLLFGTPHYGVCDTDLCEKSEVKLIKVHTYSNVSIRMSTYVRVPFN